MSGKHRGPEAFGGLIPLTCFMAIVALVAFVSNRLAGSVDYHALVRTLRAMEPRLLIFSIALTALGFGALVVREAIAVRQIGEPRSWLAVSLAGFCGTSLSNAVGLGGLTGAAVRYRIYGAVGLRPEAVTRMLLAMALPFGSSLIGLCAAGTLVDAQEIAAVLHAPAFGVKIVACLVIAAVGAGTWLIGGRRLGPDGWSLHVPGADVAAAQIGLCVLYLVAAAAALWVLLPGSAPGFVSFLPIFAAATALGVISHLPGGLGVFEAVVLLSLGRHSPPEATAAALLIYRAVFFVLPLLIAATLLTGFEIYGVFVRDTSGQTSVLLAASARLIPFFLAVLTFTAGTILVVSGATPAFHQRLALLSDFEPLWAVEASNFLGSLSGVVLMFTARGLFHRLDGAWWIATVVGGAALVFSLTKGLAYAEAMLLATLVSLLVTTHRQFPRRASLLGQPFTPPWLIAIAAVLAACLTLFAVAFRHGCSDDGCWWRMTFDAQQPRALRAMMGVCVFAIAIGITSLLRVSRGAILAADAGALARAERIIASQERSDALLALMGDKSFLFSATGRSMLMFARRGRSWIALFDPIGPRAEWMELIWQFIELAARHGGRAAFYQIRPETLPLYVEAGLGVFKLGEEARIDLAGFALAGSRRSHLRYALKRGERERLSFEFLTPAMTGPLMPTLTLISRAWLDAHGGREKGFSVAAFNARYVSAQGVALVRQDGVPIGFATVMTTQAGKEATIGLMRHTPAASPYTMEFLFTRLILTLKDEGFEHLSLGVAPLSGLSPTPLASRWYRVASLIWRHGTMLYNFKGLRTFKSKFDPAWEPRYLAVSGSLGPFFALADAAALANGSSLRRPPQ